MSVAVALEFLAPYFPFPCSLVSSSKLLWCISCATRALAASLAFLFTFLLYGISPETGGLYFLLTLT